MQDFSYRTKLKLSVVDPDPETLSQVLGGAARFFCRLPCRLFFLLRFFLSFFLPKIRGWGRGEGGNWSLGPLPSIHYCAYYEHYVREGVNYVGNLNHALSLWTFPPVPRNIPFGSSLAYHNQKKKSVQSSSPSFEDIGEVLFDR